MDIFLDFPVIRRGEIMQAILNKEKKFDFLDYDLSEELKLIRINNIWRIINEIVRILIKNLENVPQIIFSKIQSILNQDSKIIGLEEILNDKFL